MSNLELILGRLSGVRQATDGNYQCNCPCSFHEKVNNRKLYVKDLGEVVALDCKSGCTGLEIMTEIELQLKDLYPVRSEVDKQHYREQEAARRAIEHENKEAHQFWLELTILKQLLESRLFGDDKHPTNIMELWPREKQAIRMLPKYFKRYYNFK